MSARRFKYYASLAGGFLLGGLIGSLLLDIRDAFYLVKYYRTPSKVQQGYVVPSKLEIKLQDLDGNEQKEVLMKI